MEYGGGAQRRQRDPGRHPGLGHHGRDLGAGRGRHRRGQPDLRPDRRRSSRRGGPHARHRCRRAGHGRDVAAGWPGARGRGGGRSSSRWSPGCCSTSIVLFSIYLLFSGHNAPGGGFAGGLVAGLALTVRYLAGGRHELDAAAPVDAGMLLGIGLLLAVAAGAGAAAVRRAGAAERHRRPARCRCSASFHFVTSVLFDIGVYLVVVGLVLDVLRSLGAEIDRQHEADRQRRARPAGEGVGLTANLFLIVVGVLFAPACLPAARTQPHPGAGGRDPARQRREPADPHPGGTRASPPIVGASRTRPDDRPAAAGDGPHRHRDHPRHRPRSCSPWPTGPGSWPARRGPGRHRGPPDHAAGGVGRRPRTPRTQDGSDQDGSDQDGDEAGVASAVATQLRWGGRAGDLPRTAAGRPTAVRCGPDPAGGPPSPAPSGR